MNLYLIGLRGAGKSSAGQLAAEALGVPFLDCDAEVETRAGQTVAQIFAEEGEAAFRRLEREVLAELLDGDQGTGQGQLVATGGGCVLDPRAQQALHQTRRVVWLQASLEALRERVKGSDRPSLTGARPEDELALLLRQREPLYAGCATVCVDTSHICLQEVSRVIQQLWADLPHHHLR